MSKPQPIRLGLSHFVKSTPPQIPNRSRRFLATFKHSVRTSQVPQILIAWSRSYESRSVVNHSSGSMPTHAARSTQRSATATAREDEKHNTQEKLNDHEPHHSIMLG